MSLSSLSVNRLKSSMDCPGQCIVFRVARVWYFPPGISPPYNCCKIFPIPFSCLSFVKLFSQKGRGRHAAFSIRSQPIFSHPTNHLLWIIYKGSLRSAGESGLPTARLYIQNSTARGQNATKHILFSPDLLGFSTVEDFHEFVSCNGLLFQQIGGYPLEPAFIFPENGKSLPCCSFTMDTTCSSMRFAVSGAQIRGCVSSQILVVHGFHSTMSNSSVMPNRVTMERAILVACSMSLDAPVVMEWKISSSAARPPVKVAILSSASSWLIR